MASPLTESTLISKLETSDSPGIYALVSDYLRPFSDINSPSSNNDQTLIRQLAKHFISFINTSLSILPKRLPGISKSNEVLILELFKTYFLCLDCLEVVFPHLDSKPSAIHFRRLRLVRCFELCDRFHEAEAEGFRLLKRLLPGVKRKKILPDIGKIGGDDKDSFSLLVVEIVVTLVRCASKASSHKEDDYFKRVLQLMDEVKPWLMGLDCNSYEKFHKLLVYHLGKCALNLLEKKTSFSDKDLLITFCRTALIKYAKSSIKDQLFKIAQNMCSLFFKWEENKFLYVMDILDCVAPKSKVEEKNAGIEFAKLVYHCAVKCQTANASFCDTFAAYLNKTAEHYKQFMRPLNSILRLYAAGLLLVNCNLRSRAEDLVSPGIVKFECLLGALLENKKILQSSPPLLGSLHICSRSSFMSSSVVDPQFDGHTCTQSSSDCDDSTTYLSSYIQALDFLCQPLAKTINSERKQLVTGKDDASAMTMLSIVEDVFHAFCQFTLHSPSLKFEKNDNIVDKSSKTVPSVTLAAFTLSIRTNLKIQESKQLIKHISDSKWIDTEWFKYIIDCLYSIGIVLYKNKQPKEASKVLNLCCKTSWLYIKHHCGNLSEGALNEFVMDVYTRNATLLVILDETNNIKITKKLIDTLKNWSSANDLFEKLPVPIPVLKMWVKKECKRFQDVGERVDSPSLLYSLLSSNTEFSKTNIGTILEQELTAYEEMTDYCPEFCQKMQMKITNILLQKIYITPNSFFQKAQTLVRKGKAFRLYGIVGLRDCIQCLSEAIIIMKEISGEMCTKSIPIYHELCVAYCLRALCTQEATPCSQLKGFMELFNDAYRLVIRLFKLKNVSTEKWLTLLWESRRLSYALCVSPVNEAFIKNSLDEFSDLSNINFWMHNLKGNESSFIGFQQNFSFLFASSHKNSCDHGSTFQVEITVEEVQKAVLKLISNVPVPNHCTFLAGYLYGDLSQRLVANGKLLEALSFAKEAHRLHDQLFKVKYRHIFQKHIEANNIPVNFSKKLMDRIDQIEVDMSVVREMFLFDSKSWDLKDNYLSPWKIMQCYLESTLQIGNIYEILGDGNKAETYLQWGKAISCSLQLPLFIVAFSSLLGKLYVTKKIWDLAEKELLYAKKILDDNNTPFCCSKCKLILEATLYGYRGDLFQSKFNARDEGISTEFAKKLYITAMNKLTISEWKNPLSCPEDDGDATITDAKCAAGKTCTCSIMNEAKLGPGTKVGPKPNTKSKKEAKVISKEPNIVVESTTRITRSRYRAMQKQNTSISRKLEVNENVEGNQISGPSDMLSQKESILTGIGCSISSKCTITCDLSKMKCWNCLPSEVLKSGLLNDFIILKWEFVRRKLSMKLLTRVVKCFAYPRQIDEAREILLSSISLLFGRNSFCHTFSSIPLDYFHQMVAKEIPGDVFAIERAEIVYSISWHYLKCYNSKFTRTIFCDRSHIKFEDIASWLMVSNLLAVVYAVSSLSEQFSMPSLSKVLDENYWSSYFHQAAIGTYPTYQFISHLTERCKGPFVTGSSCMKEGTIDSLRIAPDSTIDLTEYVKKFFASLPLTIIISISLLQNEYTSLLQDLLPCPTRVRAWMLVSRLDYKTEPVVMLLPLDSILPDKGDLDTSSEFFQMCGKPSKTWRCPWGFAMVDDIAPAFKAILEDNFLSFSSNFENTEHNRMLCWKQRLNIDRRLEKFLRNIEDLWFGSWKCLLLGEWLNRNYFDSVLKNLVNDLRSKCNLEVNEGLLKIILGGSKKDFCFDKGGYCEEARSGIFGNAAHKLISSEVAFELLNDAFYVLEVDDSRNREPVILVLDSEVQMIPWENLPILRNQEVYRMPSVSSIFAVFDKGNYQKVQVGRNSAPFPSIDPLDAFYLVNPGGDLVGTQIKFESYFRDKNIEGKAGSKPVVKEMISALESHDLFIYVGHGSGVQYIPIHEIQKLQQCGATFLMGCSSGSLTLYGSYAPHGVPLSYQLVGSPFVVANLWEVTDKDINLFSKVMLDAWLKERSKVTMQCLQCNLLSEKFEAINLKGGKGRAKRKVPKKKSLKSPESDSLENKCSHRRTIGAFMGEARNACVLRFLNGAAPICYGVPTGISRKKDI
ncbi:separase [Medicago truncatula]|uniref:separase n=1 Tax=Medicago truncatula TaxID=3880 RepID=UPI000D2F1DFB|nr:separase [Medicago truncatula]